MKNEFYSFLAIAVITAAFLVISFLVFASKGNPALIKQKLKLGALILTFSFAASGCDRWTTTCYAPSLSTDQIYITNFQKDSFGITVDLSKTKFLTGEITNRRGTVFSYRITDSAKVLVQNDNITPLDGTFDSTSETFQIEMTGKYQIGTYEIFFYNIGKDSQDSSSNFIFGGYKYRIIRL